MKLSLTSWSLRGCTLDEAVAIARVLRFDGVDLGFFYGPALDKQALLADPEATAARVRALELPVPCFYHLFGATPADRHLARAADLDRNVADFSRVVAFCEAAEIATVFVLPGVLDAGVGRNAAIEVSAASLRALLPIATAAGVTLTIEPHVHSILESPATTLRLLEAVPGLKLTLDYAHFVCAGWRQEEVDALAPHAAHVHLRQARPGALQTPMHQGTINMHDQLATLRDAGFAGHVAVEYVHQDYMDTRYEDVLTETVAARDLVRAWAAP